MPTLMLVNPRRRARKSAVPKRRRAAGTPRQARRVRRSNPVAPIQLAALRRQRRRMGARRVTRRIRRNPIGGTRLTTNSILGMFKDAAVMGAGAVGMEMLMAQVNPQLPANMQPTAKPGLNDLLKAGLTVLVGSFASKPTKGLSRKMASGALAVQAANIIRGMLPASAGGTTAGIGYRVPNPVYPGTSRVGPGIAAYGRGATPLLSAYSGGGSPLLSANRSKARAMMGR